MPVRNGRHGAQPEHLQAAEAKMDAGDGVVVQAGGTERAAVTDTVAQNAVGVSEIVAVVPENAQHRAVMMRLALAEAEGREGGDGGG